MKKLIFILIGIFVSTITLAQNPVSYLELQKSLPKMVKGDEKIGEFDGMDINVEGMVFSNASAKYKKGNIVIELVVMDYYGSADLFDTTTEFLNGGLTFTSDEAFAKLIDIDGKKGYIVGDAATNTTVLVVVWSDRYVLNVNVTGKMDEAYVKSVYSELDLSSLK